MVKNLPAMQETQVRFLGQEDPLEKGMATYSSTLAWRIPWTEEPGGLQSTRSQRDTVEKSQTRLKDEHFHFHRMLTLASLERTALAGRDACLSNFSSGSMCTL